MCCGSTQDVAASEARGLGVSNNTRTASAIYVEVGSCARVRAYGLFTVRLTCIHYVVLLQLGLNNLTRCAQYVHYLWTRGAVLTLALTSSRRDPR
jgi:hypothetical protein